LELLDLPGVGALLRCERMSRSVGAQERVANIAGHGKLDAAQSPLELVEVGTAGAEARAERFERAPPAVGGRAAAGGHDHLLRAALDGGGDQLSRPPRRGP